ncbi:nuclear transport factor 2 family protein [Streptomyces sp. NPDC001606]
MASSLTTPVAAPAADRLAELEDRLRELEDRARLAELVDRFVHGLDSADAPTVDQYREILTEDVRLNLPNGTHQGVTGLPDFFAAPRAHWAGNQHYATNSVIDLQGDRASVRANIHAVHIPHDASAPLFAGGAHYDIRATRTPAGWRIAELTVSVLWTAEGGRA